MDKEIAKQNTNHVFLGIIPPVFSLPLARRLSGFSRFFINMNPTLRADLKDLGYEYTAEEYIGIGIVSYLFFGGLIGFLFFVIINNALEDPARAFVLGFTIGFVIVMLFTYVLSKVPTSNLRAAGIESDKNLMYALKDLVLHTDSGSTLYEAMVAVADSDYGAVSGDFEWAVRRINVGIPMATVLEDMVQKTRSEYFKKAGWQLINVIKTGSDLKTTLNPIISELNNFQKMQIQSYARELNLWSLVYMMFSVAIPTIGSTMLVVLSAFADFGISQTFFIGFVILCVLLQIFLIQFVKSRRPNVQF